MLIKIENCGECPVSTRWEGSQGRVVCCATDKTFGANTLPKSCPLREMEVGVMDRDWNGIFEAIGVVYHLRFGRLRPGKSEPIGYGDSCDDENTKQFKEWYQSDQSREDFVDRLAVLEAEVQRLNWYVDTCDCVPDGGEG